MRKVYKTYWINQKKGPDKPAQSWGNAGRTPCAGVIRTLYSPLITVSDGRHIQSKKLDFGTQPGSASAGTIRRTRRSMVRPWTTIEKITTP